MKEVAFRRGKMEDYEETIANRPRSFKRYRNVTKTLAIVVCFLVCVALGVELLKQRIIHKLRDNPTHYWHNHKGIEWLLYKVFRLTVRYPNTPMFPLVFNGIPGEFPTIDLMKGVDRKWDINVIHIFSTTIIKKRIFVVNLWILKMKKN